EAARGRPVDAATDHPDIADLGLPLHRGGRDADDLAFTQEERVREATLELLARAALDAAEQLALANRRNHYTSRAVYFIMISSLFTGRRPHASRRKRVVPGEPVEYLDLLPMGC